MELQLRQFARVPGYRIAKQVHVSSLISSWQNDPTEEREKEKKNTNLSKALNVSIAMKRDFFFFFFFSPNRLI